MRVERSFQTERRPGEYKVRRLFFLLRGIPSWKVSHTQDLITKIRLTNLGLGSWSSNSRPSRRSLAVLRGCSATGGLKQGPNFNKAAVGNLGQLAPARSSSTSRITLFKKETYTVVFL